MARRRNPCPMLPTAQNPLLLAPGAISFAPLMGLGNPPPPGYLDAPGADPRRVRHCPTCRSAVPLTRMGDLMNHSVPHTNGQLQCPGEAPPGTPFTRVGPADPVAPYAPRGRRHNPGTEGGGLFDPAKALGHGFYRVTEKQARALCGGRLPRGGHEKLVEHFGQHLWVARTPHGGKQVWSVRDSGSWGLDSSGHTTTGWRNNPSHYPTPIAKSVCTRIARGTGSRKAIWDDVDAVLRHGKNPRVPGGPLMGDARCHCSTFADATCAVHGVDKCICPTSRWSTECPRHGDGPKMPRKARAYSCPSCRDTGKLFGETCARCSGRRSNPKKGKKQVTTTTTHTKKVVTKKNPVHGLAGFKGRAPQAHCGAQRGRVAEDPSRVTCPHCRGR